MKTNPAPEMRRLAEELRRHERLYYQDAAPEISDEEYDGLLRRLAALEAEHPALADADSPTRRVGGTALAGFAAAPHRTPMLSLDNTYNPDELREFDERVCKLLGGEAPAYAAEPKIDGLSISLCYEDGRFALGATRGDGKAGDDVSANLRTVRDLPLRLRGDAPAWLEVRGEVFFDHRGFALANARRRAAGEPEFANPRNAAAGTLKQLDPALVAARPLRLLCYGIASCEGREFARHRDALAALADWGLPVSPEARQRTSASPSVPSDRGRSSVRVLPDLLATSRKPPLGR